MPAVNDDPRFAPDLYQGTAEAYERFRLGYPPVMTDSLLSRIQPSGHGRLLDLACGTGQLAFVLGSAFAEAWAVDQEPDMIRVVRAKAAMGPARIRAVLSSAEDFDAAPAAFELITVGNAFHRLPREAIARRAFEWLQSGGHLALCWSEPPWTGQAEWQRSFSEILRRWRRLLRADERLPQGWENARRARPDRDVMSDAGFLPAGDEAFAVDHRWSIEALVGFVYSTSFLPLSVIAEHAAAFEADLVARLSPCADDGELSQTIGYACQLYRRP